LYNIGLFNNPTKEGGPNHVDSGRSVILISDFCRGISATWDIHSSKQKRSVDRKESDIRRRKGDEFHLCNYAHHPAVTGYDEDRSRYLVGEGTDDSFAKSTLRGVSKARGALFHS
jgi:hypothetical protein